jgi:hypothetical protein
MAVPRNLGRGPNMACLLLNRQNGEDNLIFSHGMTDGCPMDELVTAMSVGVP